MIIGLITLIRNNGGSKEKGSIKEITPRNCDYKLNRSINGEINYYSIDYHFLIF